jgi:hypothetical protein
MVFLVDVPLFIFCASNLRYAKNTTGHSSIGLWSLRELGILPHLG